MHRVTSTRAHRVRTILMATAASLLGFAVVAPAVSAHSDEGEMDLTRFEQTGPARAEIEVGIVYANDGHLAEDASVTAQLTHDDGTAVGPVDLVHQGEGTSLYGAVVDLPATGSWAVSVTSTDPGAAVDGTLVVDDTPTTTAAPTTEAPTTTEATGDTSVVSPPTDELAAAAEDDTGNFVLVLLIALVVAALAGGALWWYRSARGDGSAPSDPGR